MHALTALESGDSSLRYTITLADIKNAIVAQKRDLALAIGFGLIRDFQPFPEDNRTANAK